jgi:phosphomevalonate kinase
MNTMSKKTLVTSAPGKLVVFGEYSVLAGYPATVLAVDCNARCEATQMLGEAERDELHLKALPPIQKLVLIEAKERGLKHPLLEAHAGVSFTLDTSAFFAPSRPTLKLGLGSSAAAAVAFAAQFTNNQHEYFAIALAAHQQFVNGLGSGIDVAASTWGGLNRFQKTGNNELSRRSISTDHLVPYLVTVFTGQSANTNNHLAALAQVREQPSNEADSILDELGSTAENLCTLIENNALSHEQGFELTKRGIETAQVALEKLANTMSMSIVTPIHHHINSIAQRFDGIAKSSGSGGGDMALCFVRPEAKEALREALMAEGFFCPDLKANQAGPYWAVMDS